MPIDSRAPTRRPSSEIEPESEAVFLPTPPTDKQPEADQNESSIEVITEEEADLKHESQPSIETNKTPSTETDSKQRIQTWKEAIFASSFKAAELDNSGLSREEIKEVGRQLFINEPMVFESAREIHDFWLTDKDLNELAKKWLDSDPASALWIFQTLQLSNEQIKRVLAEFPEKDRLEILKKMRIPGATGIEQIEGLDLEEYKLKRDELTERNPETRARRERMKRAQEISIELGQAIAEAYPEQNNSETRRMEIEQQLLSGKFKRIQDIGQGSTAPKAAILAGRELPVVLKLFCTEPGIIKGIGRPSRAGITPGAGTPREWLAYQLSRVLAPDLVPVTVFRESPLGDGILQEWEVGTELSRTKFISRAERDPKFRKQLRRNGTFDQVVNNSDRHADNKQITAQDTIKDIDNGLILPQKVDKYDSLRSCASWAVGGERIDDDIIRPYERFLAACEARQLVHDHTDRLRMEEADQTEKLMKAGFVTKIFKKLISQFKKTPVEQSNSMKPTEEEIKLARVAETVRTSFDIALGAEDAERAFQEVLNNIKELINQRKIKNSSPAWYKHDIENLRSDQYFR
ncbi:hypothetical protein KKF05_01240 [Patescibacteria group bacterium]|nr:hypothetical protein [Patescibacteria group bacterium]MBU1916186.1 hypothetical protein [Patescibacteria group bacterium]